MMREVQLPARLVIPGDMVQDLNGTWDKVVNVELFDKAGFGKSGRTQVKMEFEKRGPIIGDADSQYPVWRSE